MSEFSSIANLEIRPTGMDAARREIERELGDIEVGVSGTSNRPTGRQPRDPSSGQFMSQRGAEQRLVELLDLANERNELLEELANGGPGGGGGGGGGGGPFLGAGLLAAGGLSVGAPLATFGQRLGRMDLGNPLSLIFGEQAPGSDRATRVPEDQRIDFSISDLIGGPVDLSASDLITNPLDLGADDLINAPYDITREDIMQAPPSGRQGRREFAQQDFSASVEVNNNVQVDASLRRSEQQRFEQAELRNQVEPIINTELRRFQQRLEQQLGSGTNPRTTSSGGGGGTTGGGRFRT